MILAGEGKGISRVRKIQATVKRLKKDARSLNDSGNYSQQKSENKKEKFVSLDLWGEGGRLILIFNGIKTHLQNHSGRGEAT